MPPLLNLDQQARRLASAEGATTKRDGDFRELTGLPAPAGSRSEDVQRFSQYLAAILDTLHYAPVSAQGGRARVEARHAVLSRADDGPEAAAAQNAATSRQRSGFPD